MKKSLTLQLLEAQKDIEYKDKRIDELRNEVYDLKKQLDDRFAGQVNYLKQNNQALFNANEQLQEIIRWHVNPETAKPLLPLRDSFGNVIR